MENEGCNRRLRNFQGGLMACTRRIMLESGHQQKEEVP